MKFWILRNESGGKRGKVGGAPPTPPGLRRFSTHFLIPFAFTALVYLIVFTLPFPLSQFFNTIPPLDYAKLTHHSSGGLVAFILGLTALYGLYIWLLRSPFNLPSWASYSGVVFALTLFFSYPALAIDLFIYGIRSRGWGLYGLNPLATSPANLPPSDQWLALAAEWSDAPSPYGPLWETLALGTFKLSGGSFLSHLFWLKGIAVLSYIAAIFIIGAILGHLRPEWKAKGMLAFAWNPLVLLETAQNGHNDMLMVALMLAAVWAMVKGKDGWVMPLLALSVLVKFVTILAAPFFLLYLAMKYPTWPRRLSVFIIHGLVFILMVALPMIPLWPGLDNWAVLNANHGAGRSALALTILALRPWLGTNLAFSAGRLLLNGLWAGITLVLLWQNRRSLNTLTTVIALTWATLFWYVLLAAPVFHAWYLLWFIPLATLLPPVEVGEGAISNSLSPIATAFPATLLFSFTALLVIPYFETVRVWFPVLLSNHLLGHVIGVTLLIAPPALATMGHLRALALEAIQVHL